MSDEFGTPWPDDAIAEVNRLEVALDTYRQEAQRRNLLEAIQILEKLRKEVEAQEWEFQPMKRAHISGIRKSMLELRKAVDGPEGSGYCAECTGIWPNAAEAIKAHASAGHTFRQP